MSAQTVGMAVGVIVAGLAIGSLIAIPVMLLWNYCLVPAVPGINEVGYLQAWGLYILFNLIVKTQVTFNKDR